MKIQYLFFGTIIVQILFIHSLFAQKHSNTSAHKSYVGLSMMVYQVWLGTPGGGIIVVLKNISKP
jgi:hypothetical protein